MSMQSKLESRLSGTSVYKYIWNAEFLRKRDRSMTKDDR